MAMIIESVPNISEGKNKDIIEACVDQIRTTAGCTLLQYTSDPSHNRTVITYMGSAEACEEASVKLAKKAVELIDLTKHVGEHPRMGCVDVMPFIPIKEATTEDCVELSKRVGERIAKEADLPVFLYEQSASAAHRENLASIRKGQFEGMAEKVKAEQWIPDFGGQRIHPTGGVVAVGARPPLIAFNINLSTSDLTVANNIAKIIRRSSGGFDCVKAMGVMLEERNIAQVSINMTDFTKTPLYRVVELVKAEAARYGVHVVGTEIVGLCPMNALFDTAEYYLQIEDFNPAVQVIENHLL
ncbi:glutamate formimidoyltransferase [Clostridium aminobutyricum]|uniref:glutamate formimidoyltransferase n=1 Tax=Clostridium aminobutyricum TaxID=33953 RepID=A0A939DC12_CLOAM|nr:glutamate formimidoyltransferase [Clostridium aminobutyricum]MBN7774518.1 glutamate formimidoyltransferase [Clostridium aminobutyricum]